MPGQHAFQRRLESIEELIQKIESTADPHLRTTANELVQLIMELHGTGLERMLEIISATGQPGQEIVDKLGQDDLVASLLVLYGLHPLDLESRVKQALAKVRGGSAELLAIEEGAVRVRLHANGNGSSAKTLKGSVEEAIFGAAPDIASLVIEGEHDGFVPLTMVRGAQTLQKGTP